MKGIYVISDEVMEMLEEYIEMKTLRNDFCHFYEHGFCHFFGSEFNNEERYAEVESNHACDVCLNDKKTTCEHWQSHFVTILLNERGITNE